MWGKHLISQLEITEKFCYYPPHRTWHRRPWKTEKMLLLPPPTDESSRLLEITEKTPEIQQAQLGSSAIFIKMFDNCSDVFCFIYSVDVPEPLQPSPSLSLRSPFASSKISSFLRCSNRVTPPPTHTHTLPIALFSSLLLPYVFHLQLTFAMFRSRAATVARERFFNRVVKTNLFQLGVWGAL